MTLIAAFRSYGTPVLLGDFLVTTSVPGEGRDLKRKLRRISDRLVVGWAGTEFDAGLLLREIDGEASGITTKDELRRLLSSYDASRFVGSVDLAGWLVEAKNPVSFKWSSTYPDEVFWDSTWYLGSGGPTIEAMTGDGLHGGPIPGPGPVGDDVRGILHTIGFLLENELRARENRSSGFGHAYEALYWTGERFDYLDDVLYVNILVTFDRGDRPLYVRVLEPVYTYNIYGETAVTGLYRPLQQRAEAYIIRPLGSVAKSREELLAEAGGGAFMPALLSALAVIVYEFRVPRGTQPLFCAVSAARGDPSPLIRVTPARVVSTADAAILTRMYRAVRAGSAFP